MMPGSSWWSLIREDYEVHGRSVLRPGFQALVVYRFGVARMRIERRFLRVPFSAAYHLAFAYVRNHLGIELPYTATVGRRVIIEHQHGIVVHGNTVIGDGCVIRQGVTLGNRYLDRPNDAPVLEAGVNVGAGAKILGAVRIGQGASIGANAVVLRDVSPGALAIGVPARNIASRVRPAVPDAEGTAGGVSPAERGGELGDDH